jgi:tetratricopeptide (TPR) repeat protein
VVRFKPGLALALLACLLAPAAWAQQALEQRIERLQAKHQAAPDDLKTIQELAEALLLRVQRSADPRDANRAEALIEHGLKLGPKEARLWSLKSWSQMTAHQFQNALASARRARSLGASGALSLGLEADALVELGRYREAVDATQQMLDRVPGLPSYSRAAHLRFVHGDLEGAIKLMRQAVQAGRPRSEETAWALGQLSELYLQNGQLDLAEQSAQAALATTPGLAQNIAQLARVREAQGRFEEALELYRKAAQIQPSPEFVFSLWKLTQRLGKTVEGKRQAELLDGLARLDEKNGSYRRVLAAYYSERQEGTIEAERLARLELKARPDVYSHDALAWALYRAGKLAAARQHAEQALAFGTPDFALKYHAGIILRAAGERERGEKLLSEARARAPHFEPWGLGQSDGSRQEALTRQ